MVYRLDSVLRLAKRALAAGGTKVSATCVNWDISGFCQSPVTREIHARADVYVNRRVLVQPSRQNLQQFTVILTVKCRKCEKCGNLRRNSWAMRARAEIMSAHRTWFLTLTFSPREQYLLQLEASKALRAKGDTFDARPGESAIKLELRQQKELMKVAGGKFTKFMKRIRKNNPGVSLRYLVCTETHKTGLPHLHALLCERSAPITKAKLEGSWLHGFSQVKLVDDGKKAAWYVAKYLTKIEQSRVRASLNFGDYITPLWSSSLSAPSVET